MIAYFEAHLVELGRFFPAEEVPLIAHPTLGDEECCLKSHLLQQRSNKGYLRFHRIVEGKDDRLVRYPLRAQDLRCCQANRQDDGRNLVDAVTLHNHPLTL